MTDVCHGLPTIDEKTTRGASSPANPALETFLFAKIPVDNYFSDVCVALEGYTVCDLVGNVTMHSHRRHLRDNALDNGIYCLPGAVSSSGDTT